jgi:uncharacterized protein YaiI (UPF0178 family)
MQPWDSWINQSTKELGQSGVSREPALAATQMQAREYLMSPSGQQYLNQYIGGGSRRHKIEMKLRSMNMSRSPLDIRGSSTGGVVGAGI